jgi:NAD(P)-dependent dehydrogenase (short-subunit alcohol dehydrogenase family)
MNLIGKTAFITGSTDGVGRLVAERLGRAGAHVLLHGRDERRGAEVLVRVTEAGGGPRSAFYRADLAALGDVEALGARVRRDHPRIDLLINNAGIGSGGSNDASRRLSAEGFELRFAVNYLAHFLLTARLLPAIVGNAPARIVNVASLGQQAIDFDDVMLERGYSGTRAYCQSKLAQILFTIELAERLKGTRTTVHSLHPATFMDTRMVREAGRTPMNSVEQGADAIVYVATAAELAHRSGLFFNGQREARADPQAYDAGARKKLFELSLDLTRLADDAFQV